MILKTLGKRETKVYATWVRMRRRCNCKSTKEYRNYGGRGIKVCTRWNIFANFFEDMGEPPSKDHTLDRINNDKGYCKNNCRWASRKEQARNRRSTVKIAHKGITKSINDWAEELGIHRKTILLRIVRGWPTEKLLLPKYPGRNNGVKMR